MNCVSLISIKVSVRSTAVAVFNKYIAGRKFPDFANKVSAMADSAETAVLKNLGRELQTHPEYVSAIQEMHLEEVVKEMEVVNPKFEKLFIQR